MSRWQHPYAHFPADPYLRQHYAEHPAVAEWLSADGRGPHQNRELGLMLAGVKPAALIEPSRFRYWQPVCAERGWHTLEIVHDRPNLRRYQERSVIVALPECLWRLQRVASIYEDFNQEHNLTPRQHAQLGFLLGYTKQDIRAFLGPRRKLVLAA